MIVDDVLSKARQEKRTVLTEIEAKQIFAEAGINCTDTRLAATKDAAMALSEEIGYPVVLKISSIDITHKSDAGGVKVNLPDKVAVGKAYDEIMASCTAQFPDAGHDSGSQEIGFGPPTTWTKLTSCATE